MCGCTDIQDPANMSLKGHMLSHRTLSLETLLWARRVCWSCNISSAKVQSAPGAVRPAAVHAGTEFGAGHRRFCAPELSHRGRQRFRFCADQNPRLCRQNCIGCGPSNGNHHRQSNSGSSGSLGADGKFTAAAFEGAGLDVSFDGGLLF